MTNSLMNNYYVYGHYRNDTGELFYVGKGKNNRAFQKSGRNKYWRHIANKHGYSVFFFYKNLPEELAYQDEIALITDLKPKTNLAPGGLGGVGFASYGFLGKKHSDEYKNKMSRVMTGKKFPPKTRQHIDAFRRSISKRFDQILDTSTGIIYLGIRDCARHLKMTKSQVTHRISVGRFKRVR
jgi:hypothetical protein